jgi:hypothetical protein
MEKNKRNVPLLPVGRMKAAILPEMKKQFKKYI